jgi:protein tyrosine phosphatase (PTP) superfamily phosphohydrolase (DUF442 family)
MEDIFGFVKVSNKLYSAGQPTAAQLGRLSRWGVQSVINLALPTSDGAVKDEAAILASQGIAYYPIPVVWEAPTEENFRDFCQLMHRLSGQTILVHCAANMRVSAFLFLYRTLELGLPLAEARATMNQIWEPTGQWRAFVTQILRQHGLEYPN